MDYYQVREEQDSFPDSLLVGPVDYYQSDEVHAAIEEMVQATVDNKFPQERVPDFEKIIYEHVVIF